MTDADGGLAYARSKTTIKEKNSYMNFSLTIENH